MPEPGQLNVRERVLLHLSRLATDVPLSEHSPDSAQAGIAQAVGISRTHVPRAVKTLIREGLAEEQRARVAGHERRMSVYIATPEGVRKASELWAALAQSVFRVRSGSSVESMTGRELEEAFGRRKAIALVSRMRDGVIETEEKASERARDLEDAPEPAEFFGRAEELESASEFLSSEARVMVILGNRGYGTSSLARKFVDSVDDMNVLWISLDRLRSEEDMRERILEFGRRVDHEVKDASDVLRNPDTLLIFDDFFSVSEDVVEFFTDLVTTPYAAKVLVTAREETPAYNWFYQKGDVDSGAVSVLRVRGLDEESARKLLGIEGIDYDAFKRIFVMSRGQPMALRMLREGDFDGLKKNTVLTTEEIRYLMFLKNRGK